MSIIHRFETVSGTSVEEISGQTRYGFAMSNAMDLFELEETVAEGGKACSTLSFYDFETGKVYTPFAEKNLVAYGKPVYLQGRFWFLQGDFKKGVLTLFSALPSEAPEAAVQLPLSEVDTYNLCVIGDEPHIISQSDEFTCYYPQKFAFSLPENGSAQMIADGKVFFSVWVEEGYDEKKDCPGEDYRYYEKLVLCDFAGKVLSEEVGSLMQRADGTWWLG